MFYKGDLQSGIALAVQEAKSVICFVCDDAEESARWEREYFDDDIAQLIRDNAVTLRLTAGSQEAGFLTSLCPINTFPTVLTIRNGMVQEYIVAGTSKDDFQRRLRAAVVSNTSTPAPAPAPAPASSASQNPVADTTSSLDNTPNIVPTSLPQSSPTPNFESQTNDTESRIRASIRAGKQRARSSDEPDAAAERSKQDLSKWREQQRKLERERKDERERVRNQIKQDKEARRLHEAQEKAEHAISSQQPTSESSPAKRKPQEYRLQVRLFDGSSVRRSFAPSARVFSDVRPWLDEQRSDGTQPYTLKHVLTPLPSHTISVAEEERTLEDLALGPTANLVMVPVESYINAYASSTSNSSLPVRAISSGYNLVSSVVGAVAGTVGSFLGYNQQTNTTATTTNTSFSSSSQRSSSSNRNTNTNPRQQQQQQQQRSSSSRGRINIRTLHDQSDERGDHQFYNGNQLNFEPRRDDDWKND